MAYFPIFIDLADKKCVLVGGGAVAARKARTLLEFGAQVNVYDLNPGGEIENLVIKKAITLHRRPYGGTDDLQGAALVIAATDEAAVNRRVYADSRALGIPINIVDEPELCTFYFPAVVRRGDLAAGITTSGKYPALAVHLRAQLEEAWPSDLDCKLKTLAEVRKQIQCRIPDPLERRALLKELMEKVLQSNETDERSLRLVVQDLLNK